MFSSRPSSDWLPRSSHHSPAGADAGAAVFSVVVAAAVAAAYLDSEFLAAYCSYLSVHTKRKSRKGT